MSLHDTYQRKMKITFSTAIFRQILILLLTSGLAAAADKPELQKIRYTALSASSEQVTLQLNGSYIPKVFTLKDETPRIIFDFPDMIYGREVQGSLTTNGAIVKRIRVGMHTGEAPKTRIVFDVATLTGVTYTQKFDNTSSILTIQVLAPGKTAAPVAKSKAAAKIVDDKKKPSSETAQAQPQSITETQPLIKTEAAPGAESKPATTKETSPQLTDATKEQKSQEMPMVPAPPVASVDYKATVLMKTIPAESEVKPQPVAKETPTKPAVTSNKTEEKKTPVAAVPTPPEATADVKTATKMEAVKPATIAGGGPLLESVKFDGTSTKGEMVLFKLNDFHPPVIHGVEEGVPRIICEFNNTQLADSAKNLIKADGKYVKVIRISKNKKPDRIRVVLDLEPNHSYDLQQIFFKEDNLFVIIVNRVKK